MLGALSHVKLRVTSYLDVKLRESVSKGFKYTKIEAVQFNFLKIQT